MTPPLAESEAKQIDSKPQAQPQKGDGCPNCGSQSPWGTASWCPDCGYYPKLGGTSLRSAAEVENEKWAASDPDAQNANIADMIPAWSWPAIGGAFLIVLVNVLARVMLPLEEVHRTLITLLELTVGMIVCFIAHGAAYLYAACKSDKFGPFDFIMRPIELWKPTFQKLPEGARRVWLMAWGLALLFCGFFVMAGFNYNSLFEDWGVEDRKRNTLFQEAVKKSRKKQNADGDLEKSIKDFVGEGELEDEVVLLETQCLIIGYTKTDMGELGSVILASAPRGRLAYVGLLSQTDIPEEERGDLLKELHMVEKLKSCYLKTGVPLDQAIWIAPKLLCKIEHKSWTTQYRLERPTFMELVDPEKEKAEKEKKPAEEAK